MGARATTPSICLSATLNMIGGGYVQLRDGAAPAVAAFKSIENLTGGKGGDLLTGNDDANKIDGGDGNDVIYGHGGNDIIHGGNGNDILSGGFASRAEANGRYDGNDEIYGDGCNDLIKVMFGNEKVHGGDGNDTLSFADVNTGLVLDMASGSTTYTDGGPIVAHQGGGTDGAPPPGTVPQVTGGFAGQDHVTWDGIENLTGGAGNDILTGDSQDNKLDGGAGQNTAVFHGVESDYTFTRLADGSIQVADSVAGGDGTTFDLTSGQLPQSHPVGATLNGVPAGGGEDVATTQVDGAAAAPAGTNAVSTDGNVFTDTLANAVANVTQAVADAADDASPAHTTAGNIFRDIAHAVANITQAVADATDDASPTHTGSIFADIAGAVANATSQVVNAVEQVIHAEPNPVSTLLVSGQSGGRFWDQAAPTVNHVTAVAAPPLAGLPEPIVTQQHQANDMHPISLADVLTGVNDHLTNGHAALAVGQAVLS